MLQAVGGTVPPNTDHAISVSLPTWKSNVGYEEGQDWVISRMQCGYPRFFVHPLIQSLAQEVLRRCGNADLEAATLFPSLRTATICRNFVVARIPPEESSKIRIVGFVPSPKADSDIRSHVNSKLFGVIYPKEYAPIAKQVWQHTGDGVQSRRSEFCSSALQDGYLVEDTSIGPDGKPSIFSKGPRRYQQRTPTPKEHEHASKATESSDGQEFSAFVEERFGRNLSATLAQNAKRAMRRRIAGCLTANVDLQEALESEASSGRIAGLTEEDVFLYPTGMSSIFNTHRTLLNAKGSLKSICFGFPYTDTLKILEKWGPGCLFYGHGSSEDLQDLENRLEKGERFLALFTEFPGNPLLKSPDLKRISGLAKKYNFYVVVDETIGSFINVNVLQHADVVASSLSKIFSGDSNVMGGSVVLNPQGRHYKLLKNAFTTDYEDNVWAEDAVFLERNSRDFISRIEKINKTTEFVTEILKVSPLVKEVHYPKYSSTRQFYDALRHPTGGYGGLFSITFHTTKDAITFFDALEVMKGPSLGTNFTLSCPYTLLAHYGEADWASSFDVPFDLVRVSVGLEDPEDLGGCFQRALDARLRARPGFFGSTAQKTFISPVVSTRHFNTTSWWLPTHFFQFDSVPLSQKIALVFFLSGEWHSPILGPLNLGGLKFAYPDHSTPLTSYCNIAIEQIVQLAINTLEKKMQSSLSAARQSLVSLPFLLPSWCELASISGRRYQSTYRRTKQRLRVKPDASFEPTQGKLDSIIFNPPSSAPDATHTPNIFLPKSDIRRNLVQPEPTQIILPEELPWATTAPKRQKYHLTVEDVKEIRRLRMSDPVEWSRWKLARKFDCSARFINMVCEPIPQEQKQEIHKKVLEAVKSRWGAKRRMAREDRELRKEAWAKDE
ncbi:cystathionine gamma-synthase, putative [Talaromyces stipitatus ATCC 10500]|uniref:cystathionine gamma-synthase n=1 Tax=Talaromyces stipitatus (strain ATCC 10500 / CBS 375.48 / QM 6759 / NRRL 1006) TaxID=441959 RepID=B8MNR4_TALSN|nr:cystathionine gamma-synthase, putative [Talaromyces stipitatus ATCC 10500]EED14153.1 cystathionine gamma-synthase, putative [Talaromyces stipitatus ATCC 10500]